MSLSRYKNHFTDKILGYAEKLNEAGVVRIKEVDYGFLEDRIDEGRCMWLSGEVSGTRQGVVPVQVVLDKNRVVDARCNCDEFRRSYWGPIQCCRHLTALVLQGEELIRQGADMETEADALMLVDRYVQNDVIELYGNEEGVELEPCLSIDHDSWKVSFKIGTKKKYVIKNLTQFYHNLKYKRMHEYGKDFKFIHKRSAFAESSKHLVDFIMERIEESIVVRGMQKNSYYDVEIKRTIPLTAGSVDKLFPRLVGEVVAYSVDDYSKFKGKAVVTRENPKIAIQIKPTDARGQIGTAVTVNMGHYNLFYGNESMYCLQNDKILISDPEFASETSPLLQTISSQSKRELTFGTMAMPALYEKVLPRVSDYLEIEEIQGEKVREKLPEKAVFEFFIDETSGQGIALEFKITYKGEAIKLSKTDVVDDYAFEIDMILINSLLKHYEEGRKGNFVFITQDEEKSYQFLTEAAKELLRFGTVHVSESLTRKIVRKAPKITVGVQVKSDILNLQLDSEDIDFMQLQDILASYKRKKKFHKLKDGTFLPLEGEGLDTLAELMDGLQLSPKDFTKEQLEIPAYRALYIDKLLHGKEDVTYERDNQLREIVRNFRTVEDSSYEVPKHLKKVLRNYQKIGYRWLCLLGEYGFNGILADDMGLGKTLQIITLLQAKKQEGRTSLIVTPASLVYNWESEFQKFGEGFKVAVVAGTPTERREILADLSGYDVVVTSYDLLKRDIEFYQNQSFFYQIIDEAQYIKNQNAQVAKAVKVIKASHKLAMTGTPIENRLSELWSIFDYLMPGYLYQYEKFKTTFESAIVKRSESEIVKRLKEMVAPFILRRLKKDVLKDLPDKLEEVVYAKMDKPQEELYTAYVAKVRDEIDGQGSAEFQKNKFKVLAEITRLRQICCDPNLVYDNYKGESAKLATCMELIVSAKDGGHKVLLFSQFRTMLEIIEKRLQDEGIESYKITGETPKGKRLQLVDEFNKNDVTVFLISLKAGGTGLNLTGADMVIHYDPWWNVAAQNQATDRAHRIGQKNVVTVFKLIAKNTIEEKIIKMQETKQELADQIISGEENKLSAMTKDDFVSLLSQ